MFFKSSFLLLLLRVDYGNHGYLPSEALYHDRSLYAVWQTPYAEGSLEAVTELAQETLNHH